MSDAVMALGTLLKRNSVTIAEVRDIGGPALASNVVTVTNHSSVDGFVEKLPTTIDAGDVTFKVNFLPGNATQSATAGLLYDQINRVKQSFSITFPTTPAVTWSFYGYVTGFNIGAPVEGELTADVTISITGKPTFA